MDLAGLATEVDERRTALVEAMKRRNEVSENLKKDFYKALIEQHRYRIPGRFKTPGYVDGVEKGGVEVAAVPLRIDLRVDIGVPVDAEGDGVFRRVSCMEKIYLSAIEDIHITSSEFGDVLDRTVRIAEHGMQIYQRNMDNVI